jgi:hypothetical protein
VTELTDRPDWYRLLTGKRYEEASVFRPENLLREGRRQKRLSDIPIPEVALLDPDGDIVHHLAATGRGRRHVGWARYHTDMWVTDLHGIQVGVVGMAVGAPFAVLVAEQLAASGESPRRTPCNVRDVEHALARCLDVLPSRGATTRRACYILAGAAIPSRFNPVASTLRLARHSASRLVLTSPSAVSTGHAS